MDRIKEGITAPISCLEVAGQTPEPLWLPWATAHQYSLEMHCRGVLRRVYVVGAAKGSEASEGGTTTGEGKGAL